MFSWHTTLHHTATSEQTRPRTLQIFFFYVYRSDSTLPQRVWTQRTKGRHTDLWMFHFLSPGKSPSCFLNVAASFQNHGVWFYQSTTWWGQRGNKRTQRPRLVRRKKMCTSSKKPNDSKLDQEFSKFKQWASPHIQLGNKHLIMILTGCNHLFTSICKIFSGGGPPPTLKIFAINAKACSATAAYLGSRVRLRSLK